MGTTLCCCLLYIHLAHARHITKLRSYLGIFPALPAQRPAPSGRPRLKPAVLQDGEDGGGAPRGHGVALFWWR